MLYVCSLAEMPRCVVRLKPSHLISLLEPDNLPATPQGLAPERHLRIGVSDINEPMSGQILPDDSHIEALIAFAEDWRRETPLLVHCYAGISRSMAAALILLALDAAGREAEAVSLMAEVAPHAWPNRRMIAIADRLLGCQGRLCDAAATLVPQAATTPGRPVALPARLPSTAGDLG